MHQVWLSGLVLLLGVSPSFANGGDEVLYAKSIPDAILRQIRGSVWITWNRTDPKPMPKYSGPKDSKKSGELLPSDILAVSYNTNNSYDYLGYRFPVLSRKGAFVEVITHLERGDRAWLKLPEKQEAFLFSQREKVSGFVNIFPWGPKTRRVYQEPRKSSPWKQYSLEELNSKGIAVIMKEAKKGWLKIEGWQYEKEPIPLGWIPIFDEEEKPTIWPYHADTC